jgi:hypothetical protein
MPKIKFKRGLKENLPNLDEGEPGFAKDTEEVFIGTETGNVQLAKQVDVDSVKEEISDTSDFLTEELSKTNTRFDDLKLVDANAEVLDARGGEATLGGRFDKAETALADITYSITNFPRLTVETNDRGSIDRAIAAIPEGATLYFPLIGTYDLGGEYVITKRVKLKGKIRPIYVGGTLQSGTMFNNKIHIHADGVEIDNIGVLAPAVDNGFEISTYNASNVKFTNCITKTSSHGFFV